MTSEEFHEGGAINVFVHEIGHSLGAKHDDEIDRDCSKFGRKDDLHFLMTSDVLVRVNNSLNQIHPTSFCYNNREVLKSLLSFQKIIDGNTSGTLSTCAMRDIGKNLDRMTCWQTRSGLDNFRESDPRNEPNCEYFARRIERSDCLRLERAKNGLINIIWSEYNRILKNECITSCSHLSARVFCSCGICISIAWPWDCAIEAARHFQLFGGRSSQGATRKHQSRYEE